MIRTQWILFAGYSAVGDEIASGHARRGIGSELQRGEPSAMKRCGIAIAACAFAVLASRAEAQTDQPYPLTEMNFDMWCQEEQHLPAARCDKRLPEDDAAFQAYRNKIETYEIPYLQRKSHEQTLNRVILHNDPVDHPTRPSQPQAEQPQDH